MHDLGSIRVNESEPVIVDTEGSVGRIRLNRPEVLNVLNAATARAFAEAAASLTSDPNIRAIRIEGEGRAFMAGGDVAALSAGSETPADAANAIITPFHQGLLSLRQGPPVIAVLHGAVAGAGMSLAMACDLAVAADDAQFVFAYTKLGTSPDGSASFFLPRLLGLRRAMGLALLGETLTAERAEALGLVNRVVPRPDLDTAAGAMAEQVAAGPTRAYIHVRELFERSFGASLPDQLEAERTAFMESARRADFQEGCAAFKERREARFVGE